MQNQRIPCKSTGFNVNLKDAITKSKDFIKIRWNKKTANENLRLKAKRRNLQLLSMLLSNDILFILCSLPLCLNMIYFNLVGEKNGIFTAYLHVLAYLNNSLNFIFYYIFSSKYRKIISIFVFKSKNNRLNSTTRAKTMTINAIKNLKCSIRNKNNELIVKYSSSSTSSSVLNVKKSTNVTNLNDINVVLFKIDE